MAAKSNIFVHVRDFIKGMLHKVHVDHIDATTAAMLLANGSLLAKTLQEVAHEKKLKPEQLETVKQFLDGMLRTIHLDNMTAYQVRALIDKAIMLADALHKEHD